MKKSGLTLLLMAILPAVYAQIHNNINIKYQGEVVVGYSVGIGFFRQNRVNVHTIHGELNENAYLGLGTGNERITPTRSLE